MKEASAMHLAELIRQADAASERALKAALSVPSPTPGSGV